MDLVLVVQAIDGHEQLVIRFPLQYAVSADTPVEGSQRLDVELLWHEASRLAGKQREAARPLVDGYPASRVDIVGRRTALLQ